MPLKVSSVLLLFGLALGLFSGPAAACSRPGTPNNVIAIPIASRTVKVEWTNTASETVWWDYDVRDNGVPIALRPGGNPPRADTRGFRYSNNFMIESGHTLCARLRARTEPGTRGCVSKLFSAFACAQAF